MLFAFLNPPNLWFTIPADIRKIFECCQTDADIRYVSILSSLREPALAYITLVLDSLCAESGQLCKLWVYALKNLRVTQLLYLVGLELDVIPIHVTSILSLAVLHAFSLCDFCNRFFIDYSAARVSTTTVMMACSNIFRTKIYALPKIDHFKS